MSIDQEAKHFFEVQNELGEGPRWHSRDQTLYWVDIERGEIHSLTWSDKSHQIYPVGIPVGCFGFQRDDSLILATANGFGTWSPEAGLEILLDPRMDREEGRFNDGAIDPRGRFWAGTMTPEGFGNCLYRLDKDGAAACMEWEIGISNGIGWSPDGGTLYFTDSPRKAIYAYDFDVDQGLISNRRLWVHTPEEPGVPDGLTVDQEGCVWSARWDGWKIDRYDPRGQLIQEVQLPCQRPTSCTFGGEDLDTLVITTARVGLSEAQLAAQPLAGDLFSFRPGVKGLETNFFKDEG
jgi:sugar lactone lactonase YvrE